MTARSKRFPHELPAAVGLAGLLIGVAVASPSFFASGNLRDLALGNALALIVAVGMTVIVLVGEIDISVASQFAVCSVVAGVLAKNGVPMPALPFVMVLFGGMLGAVNGLFVGLLGLPSIIVTLAMFVAWRDALRWMTDGAWIQDLPNDFQWLGLSPSLAQTLIVLVALAVLGLFAWGLRRLAVGRAIYAVGSNEEAARLAGIEPTRVVFGAFTIMGALVGVAATLNAIRFTAVPSNAGVGMELEAIAAVVVGGTAITGGRGSLSGTLLGVILLGTIGTALTFLGINPFWEKAIQGAIILAALVSDAVIARLERHVRHFRDARLAAD